MKRFFKIFAAKKPARTARRTRNFRFQFEHLETRQLMSVTPVPTATMTQTANIQTTPINKAPTPVSVGTIDLITIGSAGIVSITGSDAAADNVKVTIDTCGTTSTADDLLTVSMTNIGSPLVKQFALSKVTSITFSGLGGDDRFQNFTGISCMAYGGEGNDILIGGSGADNLQGGNGNDYLDGSAGNDILWGGDGNDYLFGDAGQDTLHGGNNDDKLFGGADADVLFGDAGNDLLQGGAGVDQLTGGAGVDTFFDSTLDMNAGDFNKTIDLKLSTANTWSWFDDNLSDPTIRSLSRADYYHDAALTRSDFLDVYVAVGRDGTVSANEFADLQKLSDAHLVMADDVRALAYQLAHGYNANGYYQGQTLGNLSAGSTADHLQKLVNKWFLGLDRPDAATTFTYAYEYANGSLFQNGISYTDVAQNEIGDCYFMVSLASLAKSSPSTIVNMFHDNGDGTFSVRFFNQGVAYYVTVDRYLPINLSNNKPIGAGIGGTYNQSTNELWAALAEKAYAQLAESGWSRGLDRVGNSYGNISGGYPPGVYSQITGHFSQLNDLTADSQASVLVAMQLGQAVSLCTGNEETGHPPKDSTVVALHCYAVVGYDAVTKTFTLANPWNYNDPRPDTQPVLLHMTWAQITTDFVSWASVTG